MSQGERRPTVDALWRAQQVAFGPGEHVEQESFVRASEILTLAQRAGIGPRVSVLDLCCGVAGPGRFVTRELGCVYLRVDSSKSAVAVAAERALGLPWFGALRVDVAGRKARFRYETVDRRVRDRFRLTCS